MKKILGLDLGVGSIGWSLIDFDCENADNNSIVGMGSRVIPLTIDETTGFTKGNGETPCSQRTAKRSLRRGTDRYQQRRESLSNYLKDLGIEYSTDLLNLSPLELWQLRSDAANGSRLSLSQLGRIIMHINQRRGYRAAKGDACDNSSSEYLNKIKERASEADDLEETPGQYFARQLKESVYTTKNGCKVCNYRVKEKVFPRSSYENELRTILSAQKPYYPEILSDDVIEKLIALVFYQRPLKSCKHLVSICEFERREYTNSKGNPVVSGPRVAASSSPIAQVCRMWEAINNITLKNSRNKRKRTHSDLSTSLSCCNRLSSYEFELTKEERYEIFQFLNNNEKLTTKDLFRIIGINKEDGFSADKAVANGIKGNATKNELAKALSNLPDAEKYLRFDLEFEDSGSVDEVSGEVLLKVSDSYLREPLYMLWHTLYSIDDYDTLKNVLEKKFGITDIETVDWLFKIDFRGKGYSNKSAKFICKIIPHLMDGFKYSEACEIVGKNHSDSITKEENNSRELLDSLPLIKKGELRQPVVEKILNQLVHLVNDIMVHYGRPDEIRVELARSLKQSKEERSIESKRINARERENKVIAETISQEWGLRPSVNKIQKYRMWSESGHCCMYCGNPVGAKEFLVGLNAEKEHVIPRSLFFDDSFSNKVCSCRNCNAAKGQKTGYDFMKEQGEETFNSYLRRIDGLYDEYRRTKGKSGISKTKHDRLLTSRDEIPQDFIERDLRQSQYIARKAMKMLKDVCRDVYATTGSVTDFFRHVWGYDEILHSLNLPRYSAAGQTEIIEYEHKGQMHEEERIIGWTKRLDHRHHAIDALTIALVRQSYVQRLNTLNSLKDNSFVGLDGQSAEYKEKFQNLEKWAASRPHFNFDSVLDAVASVSVSFKSGRKVATPGKRIIYKGGRRIVAQTGILVPRGPLTEESVYGVIKVREKNVPVKKLFISPDNIIDERIKAAVRKRLAESDYDVKKANASLKKKTLKADGINSEISVADCWKSELVLRYKITDIKFKNIDDIVDSAVREAVRKRFSEVGNDDRKFVASLADAPLYRDAEKRFEVKSVRCFTGLNPNSVTAVSWDSNGKAIGYSKYGSNHHIALYLNEEGNLEECVVPYSHAVKRKSLGLPVIVKNPDKLWNKLNGIELDDEQELLSRFPLPAWKYCVSLQINDMFIVGLSREEVEFRLQNRDLAELNAHLYRVQRLSSVYYDFKKHDCTMSDTDSKQIENKNYIRIQSLKKFKEIDPIKVHVDRLGMITLLQDD